MEKASKNKKIAIWIIGVVTACILIFLAVQNIGVVASAVSYMAGLFAPLLIGLVMAMIINVPMRFFEGLFFKKSKKRFLQKLRRPLAFLVSVVLILSIVGGVIWLVIPALIDAVKMLIDSSVKIIDELSSMEKEEIAELPFGSVLLDIDWDKILSSAKTWLTERSSAIVNTAFGTIGSLVGGIFDFFVSVVFAVYMLFGKDKLKMQAARITKAWFPARFSGFAIHASRVVRENFRNFILGQSLEAAILGLLCAAGMLILKIPYAPMVSALVGVTALIPVVGSFIGALVGGFMILTVDPVKAVIFIVFLIILQQLEGNLIYPRVMGSRVNLPAIWILAAVTVGGGIAGPVGMLLAVPITSSAYVLFKEATAKRERRMTESSKSVEESSEENSD